MVYKMLAIDKEGKRVWEGETDSNETHKKWRKEFVARGLKVHTETIGSEVPET